MGDDSVGECGRGEASGHAAAELCGAGAGILRPPRPAASAPVSGRPLLLLGGASARPLCSPGVCARPPVRPGGFSCHCPFFPPPPGLRGWVPTGPFFCHLIICFNEPRREAGAGAASPGLLCGQQRLRLRLPVTSSDLPGQMAPAGPALVARGRVSWLWRGCGCRGELGGRRRGLGGVTSVLDSPWSAGPAGT